MGRQLRPDEALSDLVDALRRADKDGDRWRRRANTLEWVATIMTVLFVVVFVALMLILVGVKSAQAADVTFGWNFLKTHYEYLSGFKVYSGPPGGPANTLVADIPKANISIISEEPYLLNETFDEDPGGKYPLVKGAWTWVPETKNMKVESEEFMIVFDRPAGNTSAISFWFWPEKALGDQPQLMNYNKDIAESEATGVGVYYELRFGSSSGTRYSNFRKCYDGKYGGVDPNGAFPLQRYPQCELIEGENNLCNGYRLTVEWFPDRYVASIYNQTTKQYEYVEGEDAKPLDITKLEIITRQQTFWIDSIRIGGQMELRATVPAELPEPGAEVTFAISAYTEAQEGPKSTPLLYVVPAAEKTVPGKPGGLRKGA